MLSAYSRGNQFRSYSHHHLRSAVGLSTVALGCLLFPGGAWAASHAEPGNALSLPTWAIHVSSVLEWLTAMGLFWRYADVTGRSLYTSSVGLLRCRELCSS
ncbi:hypothetical protein WJX73_006554 [Symbiochloris irregularis]|uniref:Uncharacterized protein n=1 Tax=Symbiochloris irregularis TaxID=706552 RepID=A0AAW1NPY8_9CHLO